MKEQLKLMEAFYQKYAPSNIVDTPRNINKDRIKLRYSLMQEELEEYFEGAKSGDKQNIAKELSDLLFTVYGTIVEHGMQDIIEECFEEVTRSNMTKDHAPGKLIKGDSYSPANLSKIIN